MCHLVPKVVEILPDAYLGHLIHGELRLDLDCQLVAGKPYHSLHPLAGICLLKMIE